MPDGDGTDEAPGEGIDEGEGAGVGRARYYGALYGGPQPSAEPPAQPPSAPDDEITRGESKELPLRKASVLEKFPDGMAELIVYEREATAEGRARFGLKVTCFCTPINDLGVKYGRPDLDPGSNLETGGPPPSKFLDRMGNWSYMKTELAQWLCLHRDKHQDQLELVIRDDTGYRIPWELFWLPSLQGSGLAADYLGAVLTVSRWLRLSSYWPEFVQPFANSNPYRATGPALAYVADDMGHDRDLLLGFDVEYASSVRQLFDELAHESRPLAMVYIACHGEFGDNPDDCELDGFPLGRATRRNDDLPRLREQATLVFLNGCRTGSVGVDVSKYNDGALRGFAVVFLRSGAAGVLATTGAVGNEEAGALAGTLFRQLEEDASLPVAEAVRRLRADAAEKIARLLDDDIVAEDELLQLLYPFMYVYFGSPRMLMSIAASGENTGTGEPGPVASGET